MAVPQKIRFPLALPGALLAIIAMGLYMNVFLISDFAEVGPGDFWFGLLVCLASSAMVFVLILTPLILLVRRVAHQRGKTVRWGLKVSVVWAAAAGLLFTLFFSSSHPSDALFGAGFPMLGALIFWLIAPRMDGLSTRDRHIAEP